MDANELLDDLARRGEAGDAAGLAALCSPELRFRQNIGTVGGVAELVAMVEMLNDLGVSVAYSDVRRIIAGDRATEQHLLTLTRADGASVSTDVCLVVRVEDGLIAEVDEYLDGAALAGILG